MPIEWSGLGPGLLLTLDRSAVEPLRSQLERQLREAIRAGRLAFGERLPSSRELARALELSRGLVQDCYAQLQSEGYLSTRVGSATRVAVAAVSPGTRQSRQPAPTPALVADFQSGVPDLASFPRADWLWAMREALRVAPTASFDYGDARGSTTLREVLSGYLRRVRAAAADPEHTVICTGYAQGLALTLRALARTGVRTVACEDPGALATARNAAGWAGLEVVPVPVDQDGIDVTALTAGGARAVIVTPAHQWPTGVVLSPDRRLAMVAWATTHDAIVIEDDYDAEFRYDRDPVGSLHGLAPDRVVSLGTVSKSLAPSVRLGWILCPPSLAETIAEEKRLHDRGSPGLDQLALATLIESGRYDRHLRRMRTVYATRRTVLLESLADHAPDVHLTGLAAGFHAVAHLPAPATEPEVVDAARALHVGFYGMSRYRSTGNPTPAQLVLGFGNLTDRAVRAGIEATRSILHGGSDRRR